MNRRISNKECPMVKLLRLIGILIKYMLPTFFGRNAGR